MAETEDGQARESLLENGETTVTQAVGSVGLELKGNPSGWSQDVYVSKFFFWPVATHTDK